MSQLDLFDPAVAREESQDHELERLADSLPERLRFGTCSWTFPGWNMVYRRRYPSKKAFTAESLGEYARYPLFRTVEIDRSYYGPVSARELASYAGMMPEGFDAGMKVWSEITAMVFPRHPRFGDRAGKLNPAFLDPELFVDRVIRPIEESFSEQIGPLILEIPPPPRGGTDPARLESSLSRFLARAPAGYRYAFEVRSPDLLSRRSLAILADFGAAHVYNYWSAMPGIGAQRRRVGAHPGPFVLIRLMLPPGTSYEQQKRRCEPFDAIVDEQPEMRRETLELVREALELDIDCYVFVNNKAEGSSPLTVRALAEELLGNP